MTCCSNNLTGIIDMEQRSGGTVQSLPVVPAHPHAHSYWFLVPLIVAGVIYYAVRFTLPSYLRKKGVDVETTMFWRGVATVIAAVIGLACLKFWG